MRFNEQTITDCNLRPAGSGKSLFDFFNYTFTSGGATSLEDMLLNKKNSVSEINSMHQAIRYMAANPEHFVRLNNADIEYMRQYFRLNLESETTQLGSIAMRLGFAGKHTYQLLRGNVLRLTHFLRMVARKIGGIDVAVSPGVIADQYRIIHQVLNEDHIKRLMSMNIEEASAKKNTRKRPLFS